MRQDIEKITWIGCRCNGVVGAAADGQIDQLVHEHAVLNDDEIRTAEEATQ